MEGWRIECLSVPRMSPSRRLGGRELPHFFAHGIIRDTKTLNRSHFLSQSQLEILGS